MVGVILHTEPTNPSHRCHALLKTRETTILVNAVAFAEERTPRIVLGSSACDCRDRGGVNSQQEEQSSHNRHV